MLITHEPGIMSTIKIRNKKGGSFHFDAVPLIVLSFTTIVYYIWFASHLQTCLTDFVYYLDSFKPSMPLPPPPFPEMRQLAADQMKMVAALEKPQQQQLEKTQQQLEKPPHHHFTKPPRYTAKKVKYGCENVTDCHSLPY